MDSQVSDRSRWNPSTSAKGEADARYRAAAVCAACQQHIGLAVELVTRDGRSYHPVCAQRLEAVRSARTVSPAAPMVIGTISGIALPLGEECTILTEQGDRHERYTDGAFEASINRGGQSLQVDHDGVPVAGHLALSTSARRLLFRLRVHETARGRWVLEQARRGGFRGCSVRFRPRHEQYIHARLIEVQEADLTEVSLCHRYNPAWYGTSLWVEG